MNFSLSRPQQLAAPSLKKHKISQQRSLLKEKSGWSASPPSSERWQRRQFSQILLILSNPPRKASTSTEAGWWRQKTLQVGPSLPLCLPLQFKYNASSNPLWHYPVNLSLRYTSCRMGRSVYIHCFIKMLTAYAPVAQLDRAPDFESGCRGSESLRVHQ